MKSQREGDSQKSWASPDKTGNRLSFGTELLKRKELPNFVGYKITQTKEKIFLKPAVDSDLCRLSKTAILLHNVTDVCACQTYEQNMKFTFTLITAIDI
jgi:hypothetical protein